MQWTIHGLVGLTWVQNGSIDELQLKMVFVQSALFSYSETTSYTWSHRSYVAIRKEQSKQFHSLSFQLLEWDVTGRQYGLLWLCVSYFHRPSSSSATPKPKLRPREHPIQPPIQPPCVPIRYEEPGADHEAVKLRVLQSAQSHAKTWRGPCRGSDCHVSLLMTISRTPNRAGKEEMRSPKQLVKEM